MSKYKVGDVAALFSKPKEPTTEAGKKLQTLFQEFHGKNKSTFQSQKEASPKWRNKSKTVVEENGDQKVFKKNKKRKFSATFDEESTLSEEHKKFKGTDTSEVKFKNKQNKSKKFSEERDFPRKKKKSPKLNSFNSNSFSNSEINGSAENEIKSIDTSELNNSPKGKKVKSNVSKKPKHRTYDANGIFDKGPMKKPKLNKEALDSNDESFKEEIKEFIKKNSKKSKKKNRNNADSKETPDEDSLLFIGNSVNKHESEASPNFKPRDKTQVSGFIRRPKNRNKAINNFERDNNEGHNVPNKGFDSSDTLFKSENEDYVKSNSRKFKKKFTDINSSPRTTYSRNEPEFIKLLERNPEDETDKLSRTLFVGNLPLTTRLNELKDLFSTFGEIEFIRFKGIETDKAKIFGENISKSLNPNYAAESAPGFILFKERESAVKALTLCGTVFKNRHITVDFAMPAGSKKLYDEKRSIFIGNLPFDVSDESIWNAFSDCGKIEGVRVVRDKTTGIGKGFGYVLFSSAESRKNALSLEDFEIEGRSVRIKAVDSNKKTQRKSDANAVKSDTFKSRAIRMKNKNANSNSNSRKSIKKLMNKEKAAHKKKKIASLLQKSMK